VLMRLPRTLVHLKVNRLNANGLELLVLMRNGDSLPALRTVTIVIGEGDIIVSITSVLEPLVLTVISSWMMLTQAFECKPP
jgi:hypothetical protein